jgi:NTP pyrophosphatase (non-canonical NTP hydrolase)
MNEEALVILQEECSEVIHRICKCMRFGYESNRDRLEQELGDLLAMVEILQKLDMVSWANIEKASLAKHEKLKQWSNLGDIL